LYDGHPPCLAGASGVAYVGRHVRRAHTPPTASAFILRPDDPAPTYSEAQVVKPPEGWDYIGQWSGMNLRAFFERIGAGTTARWVAFRCADDYTEEPGHGDGAANTNLLATKYAKEPIADPFGFPLRLRTATKLGFKNAKW
jgi:DMSO/TMAO reductase YedYZ molybdopterin-dependent catalytic subunit